jgi:FKBP-type peptidyl-prolyl cis-trans isomerase
MRGRKEAPLTKLSVALAALLLCSSSRAVEGGPAPKPASPAALSPEAVDRALYATGLSIAKNLEPFSLAPAELERLVKGIKDGLGGTPEFPFDDAAQQALTQLATARLELVSEKEKVRGGAYLKQAAAEKGAVKRESGLVFTPLAEGQGASPRPTDRVKINYRGTLVDGKEFGGNARRGAPFEFQVDQIMPCWTEALGLMKVGGKAKVVCPAALAYGAAGRPPQIAGNAVLVFAIELVAIVSPGAAPAPPAAGKGK